ncbi:MAG: leucine-rich repeat domain-containing protein [Lachnospiraceae bacterium]|nr:leucine-rich repeat domain-containing protein [Lachnospiraceae bacterium]
MKKILPRAIGAVLIALALVITQVPPGFVQAVGLSGDFEKEGSTVYGYHGTASAVSIPNGTKTIASEAFSNQSFLTSVIFPASLETIENGAFRSCSSLNAVVLPGNLETLESGAFAKCENLKSFTFSNVLYELGAGVFSGDDKLATLDLNKNPYFVFTDGALYNKDKTKLYCVLSGRPGTHFTIPDSVLEIERYAFWGCDNLETVTLSSNLAEIPEFAFSNCENLEEITVPLSVRKISAKAFEDCGSLTNVRIPASVISIHDTAFDGCRNLNIISDVGTTAYEFFRNFDLSQSQLMAYEDSVSENAIGSYFPVSEQKKTEKKKSDQTDTAAESAKKKPSAKFETTNPADVSKADVWEDYSGDDGSIKTRVVGNEAVVLPKTFSDSGFGNQVIDGKEGLTVTGEQLPSQEEQNPAHLPLEMYPASTDIITPSADGLVSRKAYYQNGELTHVGFADGTKRIGDLAFARSSAKSVVLPEGLQSIGYGAFYHCDGLEQVYIPDSVTDIQPEAFANTPFLEEWENGNGDDFLIVGDGVLLAYRGDSAVVTIPDTVKKIAGSTFAGKIEIQQVNLGNNLEEIGEAAFWGCNGLTKINGGGKIRKIADRAFDGCPITDLHIPASVEKIGLGAFTGAVSPSVVFESAEALPALSYEQTSTRLTNEEFRKPALGDIPVAAVSGSAAALTDTVLDDNYLGFRGLIVNVPGGVGGSDKTAVLLRSSATPDETGIVRIPASVNIDGQSYSLTSASPSAFSYYENKDVRAIILPPALGAIGDYISSMAFDASAVSLGDAVTTGDSEGTEGENTSAGDNGGGAAQNTDDATGAGAGGGAGAGEATGSENGENSGYVALDPEGKPYVETVNLGSTYPDAISIAADPVDDDAYYRLFVSNDAQAEEQLKQAVAQKWGMPVSGQLVSMNLQMVDAATNVPITNFGKEQVLMTVPVSDTLYDQQICAVSLKEDGSLDIHYGTKSEVDGKKVFSFATNHFTPYGIYAGVGEVAMQIAENTAELHNKDVSPDTGDHFPLIPVVAIFFACAGGLLLLNIPGLFRRKK